MRRLLIILAILVVSMGLLLSAYLPTEKSTVGSDSVLSAFPTTARHDVNGWQHPRGSQGALLSRRGPEYPPVQFMIASDIHHLSRRLWEQGSAFHRFQGTNDGKLLQHGDAILSALRRGVDEENPEFLVITGDLTTNGARKSHEDVASALSSIEAAGVPVYVIPGNHDINNPWASAFRGGAEERVESVSAAAYEELYRDFGYREAIDRSPSDLSYLVEHGPRLWLLLLDTNWHENNQERGVPYPGGAFRTAQRRWILRVLEEAKTQGIAVLTFSHHSFISHSTRSTYQDVSRVIDEWQRNTREFWDRGVSVMFTGHIHAQDAASIRGRKGEWIYDIATGALSIFPHSYRTVTIDTNQHLALSSRRLRPTHFDNGGTTILADSRDQYLNQFITRFTPRLVEELEVSRRAAEQLAWYPAVLSINHMAGEESGHLPVDAVPNDAIPESRALWDRHAPQRLSDYVAWMGTDEPPRDSDIEIDLTTGMWRSRRE